MRRILIFITAAALMLCAGMFCMSAETGDSQGVPSTAVPYTAQPDTARPDTAVPSTSVPETAEPSTAEPSTSEPSTLEPSTAEPSTGEPSTAVPSTGEPSTAEPSTAVPSTGEPSTSEPSTAVPSTGEPQTSEPDDEPQTEPSKPSGGNVITDEDLHEPETPEEPSGETSEEEPPQTAESSDVLPEGVEIKITGVILYSDGTGTVTLSLSNSTYVTYTISSAVVSTTAGDMIVNQSHDVNYGSDELVLELSGAHGDVSSVTLIISQKDPEDGQEPYSGEVTIPVTEDTVVENRQAWTMDRIIRTAAFVLLGLIVAERVILAVVLFCNYKRDGMRKTWPWFVFLGGLWVFILYFVIISQFGIDAGDAEDDDSDFKQPRTGKAKSGKKDGAGATAENAKKSAADDPDPRPRRRRQS